MFERKMPGCDWMHEDIAGLARTMKADGVEMWACATVGTSEDGRVITETCNEEDAEFWSVYLHATGVGMKCVADFWLEEDAEAFWKSLSEMVAEMNRP